MPQAAAIIAAAAAVAGTTQGIVQAQDQKRTARIQGDRQRQEQERQRQKLVDQDTILKATKARDDARAKQRTLALNAGGRSSTILTGPAGVIGSSPTPGKSLLGV